MNCNLVDFSRSFADSLALCSYGTWLEALFLWFRFVVAILLDGAIRTFRLQIGQGLDSRMLSLGRPLSAREIGACPESFSALQLRNVDHGDLGGFVSYAKRSLYFAHRRKYRFYPSWFAVSLDSKW
jgi:hypothetical protein